MRSRYLDTGGGLDDVVPDALIPSRYRPQCTQCRYLGTTVEESTGEVEWTWCASVRQLIAEQSLDDIARRPRTTWGTRGARMTPRGGSEAVQTKYLSLADWRHYDHLSGVYAVANKVIDHLQTRLNPPWSGNY